METNNPWELREEIRSMLSKLSPQELVAAFNGHVGVAAFNQYLSLYHSELGKALVKTGLDCSIIWNETGYLNLKNMIRIEGNKVVLKFQYVETLPRPNNRSSEDSFNPSIIRISKALEWHEVFSSYRFKVSDTGWVYALFKGASRFDIVPVSEYDKDEINRIPVLWGRKIVYNYIFDIFTDDKIRLVAVFIPNYHLDREEHEFAIFEAKGSKVLKRLFRISA